MKLKTVKIEDGLYLRELSCKQMLELQRWQAENKEDMEGFTGRLLSLSLTDEEGTPIYTPYTCLDLPFSSVNSLVEQALALNGLSEKKD